jgi:dihydropteroate synthase
MTKIKIMGVLNITPDSFFDGGRYFSIEAAVERALQMIEEGADFIDVGGESTRPFSESVPSSEEAKRVLPIIECLAKNTTVPISIDTRHPEIMQSAIEVGASIVNDIYALQAPGALEIVARKNVMVCLMHMQGLPKTMQEAPYYKDVVKEIFDFLAERIAVCEKMGIAKNRIWIDPGFCFGKTLKHNLTLLGQLSIFKTLGCPILAGLSRKSIFKMLLDLPVEERLSASLAAAILAAQQGASIIRTHDVKPTWECLKVVEAVAPYWREKECHQSVNILEPME